MYGVLGAGVFFCFILGFLVGLGFLGGFFWLFWFFNEDKILSIRE